MTCMQPGFWFQIFDPDVRAYCDLFYVNPCRIINNVNNYVSIKNTKTENLTFYFTQEVSLLLNEFQ